MTLPKGYYLQFSGNRSVHFSEVMALLLMVALGSCHDLCSPELRASFGFGVGVQFLAHGIFF